MTKAADHLRIAVGGRAALRAWLAANHASSGSIWLVTWRKPDPRHLPYDAIVEEALCWGWVDSLPRRLDESRTMLRLSPRRRGSAWSALNKARIERLEAAGLMAPPGLAAVARAKADGSWSKLDAVETLAEPADLVAALARHPPAAAHWAAFPRSARRGILEWIEQARTPVTRVKRVEETATEAQANRRANRYRGPG
ncbi:YdeI/OmpD-associated family protein [Falsiroseomonas sp. HW251]|uniref:YdeI/OmpD-associated family protein n=1 Tax=Falsiroseomonas sp. HW251 TaxID=3390998 RepID=UPI003D31FFCB